MDLIGKTVDLVNNLLDLMQGNWMHIIIDDRGHTVVLFMIPEMFFNHFQQFDVIEIDSKYHKTQASTEVEGITFKTFLTKEDHEKFVLKIKQQ